MTKEKICKTCIRYNKKENKCELKKDTYKVYKCTEYVSIFICNVESVEDVKYIFKNRRNRKTIAT